MMAYPMQDTDRDLVLKRIINAPREKVYRCWTEPALLTRWFAPKPWSTPRAELDVRPGGAQIVTMADEQGNEFRNPGQYLELVPNERLVFTDAFVGDWAPSEKPFFTGIILLDDAGEGCTGYTAIARHWTVEDAQNHKAMGFHEGWGEATEQREEVARSL